MRGIYCFYKQFRVSNLPISDIEYCTCWLESCLNCTYAVCNGISVCVMEVNWAYSHSVCYSFMLLIQYLRCVGFIWHTSLVGHLYLSGIWHGLQSIMDTCYIKIGQCVHNIDIILSLIVNTTRSIYVIICRVRIFTLDYHNLCISIPIGKCGMIMYMQLLTRWAMIVSGVGSAHNRATHLIMFLIVLILSSFRTHEPHQCIIDNIENVATG